MLKVLFNKIRVRIEKKNALNLKKKLTTTVYGSPVSLVHNSNSRYQVNLIIELAPNTRKCTLKYCSHNILDISGGLYIKRSQISSVSLQPLKTSDPQ